MRLRTIFQAICKLLFYRVSERSGKDILVVTRADLFPVDHGAAVKIVRTAQSLSRLGQDVYLCTDKRGEYYRFHNGKQEVLHYPLWLRFMALPRSVALLRLLLRGFPFSNAFLYFPLTDLSYIYRSLWLAGRHGTRTCIAEFPAYVYPCSHVRSMFGGKLMLVEHNVEYERLKSQIQGLKNATYEKLKQTELQMCTLADVIVTVSDNDREKLAADGVPCEKLVTIPHGVDLHDLQTAKAPGVRARYGIGENDLLMVYHGTYSYGPNLQAVQLLATEILPRLEKAGITASVLAVGSRPPERKLHQGIHFTGSVADLGEILPAADIAVIPLQDGGGTRMKILDYFAARVPVVSTAKGIEGIPVTHGVEAIIVDDFEAMSDAVVELAGHPQRRADLISAATAFVNTLGWDSIAKRYLPLLASENADIDAPGVGSCP